MESTSSLIPYLFAVTFAIAIAFGVWQYLRASKARREKHRSADAATHGDAPGHPQAGSRQ
jgi:hypothetical protein